MELNGAAFSFETPDAWEIIPAEGMVAASAPPDYLGFRPTIVLRESRIDNPAPTTLASISQANLRAIPQEVAGAYVVNVEAIPDGDAGPGPRERRRIWALAPVKPPTDDLLGVIMIQDLMVAGNSIAELTLTLPVVTWRPDGSFERILDSLRPLEHGVLPQLTTQVPEAVLDQWATARDGVPREDVTVQGYLSPVLLGNTYELSPGALTELKSLSSAGFFGRRARNQLPREELRGAGFIDDNGSPTELGEVVLGMFNHGKHWVLENSGPEEDNRGMDGWSMEEATLLLIGPSPQEPVGGKIRLARCATDDLARVLLMWSGTQPGWRTSFSLPGIKIQEMLEHLVGQPLPQQLGGDAAAFADEPWQQFSFIDDSAKNGVVWITTPHRGSALCYQESHQDEVTIASFDDQPLWAYLSLTAATINFGEKNVL